MSNINQDNDDFNGPYLIPVESMKKHAFNPFTEDTWNTGVQTTRKAVRHAIANNLLENRPHGSIDQDELRADTTFDIRRIAYLVINPDLKPIDIDIDMYSGEIIMDDGCHRLAAAIYRKDAEILVNYSGYVDDFHRKFKKKRKAAEPCMGL
jgi:hypothetical protein